MRPALLALSLGLAACSGSTTSANLPSIANPLDSDRDDVMAQLNVLRLAAGVPIANDCYTLNISASAHSDDMRDNNYLSDVAPDGSTVRTRACSAGYEAACGAATIPMAELVAQGFATGEDTVNQWAADMTSDPILINAQLTWVGVGRSIGATAQYWTLDMASVDDPSCPAH